MKKLLVTASTFPRFEGDSEPRFILDLCKGLSKYFDVTVLVPAAVGAKDKEVLEGVKVVRYHYFPIRKFETLCYPGAIVPRIKEKKIRILLVPFLFISLLFHLFKMIPSFDVIHAHWIIPQGIVQSFFKKPYLITGHGGDVTSLNKGYLKWLKRKALKKASYVTVVSSALLKEINEICSIEKVEVISMGCYVNKFGKKYKKDNLFGQNGKKVILFVGRLAEKKGVTYLIEAMKQLDAILIIVGSGPLENLLKKQAKEQGDKIKFIGPKTHEELKTIYASADIFVGPSITAKDGDKEGLPLVLMEAMASGLPVVASNSGGIKDLIQDGVNGFITEEKDVDAIAKKVNLLLNSEEVYNEMALNAMKIVKNYDYDVIAHKYAKIIEGIVK